MQPLSKIKQSDLEDLRSLVLEKRELEHDIKEREDMAARPPRLSETVAKSGFVSDPTGNTGSCAGDMQLMLKNKAKQIDAMICAIETKLDVLRSIDRRIIRFYYFKGYSDLRVSHAVYLSVNRVGEHRRQAVEKITGERYQKDGAKQR